MSGNNGKVAITGRTYPVRAQLAALGGVWDKVGKCWMVPAERAEEARRIVSTPVRDLARDAGQSHYVKVGQDWCVSVAGTAGLSREAAEVKMAGKAVPVRTKAGRVKDETLGLTVRQSVVGDWIFGIERRVRMVGFIDNNSSVRDPGEDAADRWNEGGGVA